MMLTRLCEYFCYWNMSCVEREANLSGHHLVWWALIGHRIGPIHKSNLPFSVRMTDDGDD